MFLSLGYDPIKENFLIIGIDPSEKVARSEMKKRIPAECPEVCYAEVFRVDDDLGYRLSRWIRSIGVPLSEVNEVVRSIGRSLVEFIE